MIIIPNYERLTQLIALEHAFDKLLAFVPVGAFPCSFEIFSKIKSFLGHKIAFFSGVGRNLFGGWSSQGQGGSIGRRTQGVAAPDRGVAAPRDAGEIKNMNFFKILKNSYF